KTSDPAAERNVLAEVARSPHRVRVDMRLTGTTGEPLVVHVRTDNGLEARVETDARLEEARTRPLDESTLRDKLGRLGDTPFVLGDMHIDVPANAIVPVSSLNRARRAAVDALFASAAKQHEGTQ